MVKVEDFDDAGFFDDVEDNRDNRGEKEEGAWGVSDPLLDVFPLSLRHSDKHHGEL